MQQWFPRYCEREVLQQSFQLAKRSSILISMNSTKGKQWLFYHSYPRDHHRLAIAGCCEPLHRSCGYPNIFTKKLLTSVRGTGMAFPYFQLFQSSFVVNQFEKPLLRPLGFSVTVPAFPFTSCISFSSTEQQPFDNWTVLR